VGAYTKFGTLPPYCIVVKSQLAERWAQIEARFDPLTPGHRVLRYPDGTVAVEFKDREPLCVLYKSLFGDGGS